MKNRNNEQVGAGFVVFRRGKKTNRIAGGNSLPFEHANYIAAKREAQRLTLLHPGEEFTVWKQMHRTTAVEAKRND